MEELFAELIEVGGNSFDDSKTRRVMVKTSRPRARRFSIPSSSRLERRLVFTDCKTSRQPDIASIWLTSLFRNKVISARAIPPRQVAGKKKAFSIVQGNSVEAIKIKQGMTVPKVTKSKSVWMMPREWHHQSGNPSNPQSPQIPQGPQVPNSRKFIFAGHQHGYKSVR